jgi:hypothetical protein
VKLEKHLVAVINGVLYDTYDCSGEGTVRIEGYWALPSSVESAAKRNPSS